MQLGAAASRFHVKDLVDDEALAIVTDVKIVLEGRIKLEESITSLQDWAVDVVNHAMHDPLNFRNLIIILLVWQLKTFLLENVHWPILGLANHRVKLLIKMYDRDFALEFLIVELLVCVCSWTVVESLDHNRFIKNAVVKPKLQVNSSQVFFSPVVYPLFLQWGVDAGVLDF